MGQGIFQIGVNGAARRRVSTRLFPYVGINRTAQRVHAARQIIRRRAAPAREDLAFHHAYGRWPLRRIRYTARDIPPARGDSYTRWRWKQGIPKVWTYGTRNMHKN